MDSKEKELQILKEIDKNKETSFSEYLKALTTQTLLEMADWIRKKRESENLPLHTNIDFKDLEKANKPLFEKIMHEIEYYELYKKIIVHD